MNQEMLQELIAAMERIIRQQFDEAFDRKFDEAFDRKFDEAFDRKFDEAFDRKFDEAFDRKFDEAFDRKFDEAFDFKVMPKFERLERSMRQGFAILGEKLDKLSVSLENRTDVLAHVTHKNCYDIENHIPPDELRVCEKSTTSLVWSELEQRADISLKELQDGKPKSPRPAGGPRKQPKK